MNKTIVILVLLASVLLCVSAFAEICVTAMVTLAPVSLLLRAGGPAYDGPVVQHTQVPVVHVMPVQEDSV